MAHKIHPASDCGSTRRAAHTEMVERRRARGWGMETDARGNTPRRQCITTAGQHLSPLHAGSVDPIMATETNRRGCHLRTVRGRWCGWLSEEINCQTVLGGIEATYAEVRPGTASRENASAGIRTICGRATAGARTRETGDVQLSRFYPHL